LNGCGIFSGVNTENHHWNEVFSKVCAIFGTFSCMRAWGKCGYRSRKKSPNPRSFWLWKGISEQTDDLPQNMMSKIIINFVFQVIRFEYFVSSVRKTVRSWKIGKRKITIICLKIGGAGWLFFLSFECRLISHTRFSFFTKYFFFCRLNKLPRLVSLIAKNKTCPLRFNTLTHLICIFNLQSILTKKTNGLSQVRKEMYAYAYMQEIGVKNRI